MPASAAFAPGRANLIGEHTDYNDGLALPFAIAQGTRVRAQAVDPADDRGYRLFAPGGDCHDFVDGVIAELDAAGVTVPSARIEISGEVPIGAGLSSSAALTVALVLALIALGDRTSDLLADDAPSRLALARLCSRVENDHVGARTGLLDQLASLSGIAGRTLRIDFRTLQVTPIPLELGDWKLVTVPSGEAHSLAASGYNRRREECDRARSILGLETLREATAADAQRLPEPLGRRVRHVLDENVRVDATVRALQAADLSEVGRLLDASHGSLRDLYDSSTVAVERTVERIRAAGAAGARMIGGGFGGHVLALLPPEMAIPDDALELIPSGGAHLLEGRTAPPR